MNVARRLGSLASRRTYATIYVPPASLNNTKGQNRQRSKPIPESPNFYTGRASYFDQVSVLETAITHTRTALQNMQLLPLPKFALDVLPPLEHVWMTKDTLSQTLNTRLTTARYRRLLSLLNQLGNFRRIASVAGCETLASHVEAVLEMFERENKEAYLARGKRKPVEFDEHGRSYTVGRRKESAARVWVIPVQDAPKAAGSVTATLPALPAPDSPVQEGNGLIAESAIDAFLPEVPSRSAITFASPSPAPVKVTTTNILINNTPLSQYL